MKWILLSGAILAEVLATASLRAASQEEAPWHWWISVLGGYTAAFGLLYATLAAGAPLAATYAIWAGVGVALTAVVAWLIFAERLTIGALSGIALIIAGVVLVESSGSHNGSPA